MKKHHGKGGTHDCSLSTVTAQVREAGFPVIMEIADTNDNGITDGWESEYFTDSFFNPDGDKDGDGFTNREEWKAGTNPLDRNFVIGNIKPVANADYFYFEP